MKDAHVKAVPVNSVIRFVQGELPAADFARLLERFPEEERRYLRGSLLAHELAPLDILNRFCVAAAEAKGEPVKSFCHRAGRFGAEQGIRSVYRFVMLVLSPEAVLKKAPLMWSRVYDCGEISIESTDTSARVHIRDFPSHPAGCARITGWLEVLGEKSGARDIAVQHATCMAEGGSECLWTLAWKE